MSLHSSRQVVPDSDFLRSVPLFFGLTPTSLRELAARTAAVSVRAGEYLFHEGDPSDSMYVVGSGRLEVLMFEAGPLVARVLTRGAVVGELGILTGTPRSASVRARRDSELMKITGNDFAGLLDDSPHFAAELSRALGRALQASRGVGSEINPAPRTVAILPMGRDVPVQALSERLGHWLETFGTVGVMRAGDSDPADESAIARQLDERERQNDRVLLVVGATDPSSWRDFCARQADRVLLLVNETSQVERSPHPELRNCDLVRCAPPARIPIGAWLSALQPRAVYNVDTIPARPAQQEPIAALARRLAGRSVGLVLSGGGARGSAHIGVVDRLAAAGVLIDRVVGCSMGSLAAAAVATGMSPAEMADGWYRYMVASNPLSDYTFPAVALVRGAKLLEGLREQFGSTRIEDLPHEFFCVSSDIHAGQLHVHRYGPLVDAIYASMAIPGLLPPATVDGCVLVDGGVLNNLPVDVLTSRGEGPVVAVNLTVQSSRKRPSAESDPGRARRLASVIQATVTGAKGSSPPLRETLMRALLLGSVDSTRAAREKADVLITPDTRGIGLLEFGALQRGIDAGRTATNEVLADPGNRERLLLD